MSINTAQHRVHPTGGSLRVFRQFAWLEVGSGKIAFSRPAHPQVTLPVSPPGIKNSNKLLNVIKLNIKSVRQKEARDAR